MGCGLEEIWPSVQGAERTCDDRAAYRVPIRAMSQLMCYQRNAFLWMEGYPKWESDCQDRRSPQSSFRHGRIEFVTDPYGVNRRDVELLGHRVRQLKECGVLLPGQTIL